MLLRDLADPEAAQEALRSAVAGGGGEVLGQVVNTAETAVNDRLTQHSWWILVD